MKINKAMPIIIENLNNEHSNKKQILTTAATINTATQKKLTTATTINTNNY